MRETAKSFFARLAETQSRALLLNIDATLTLFAEAPDTAMAGLTPCLQQIVHETDTRVILITGRAAKELHSQLQMDPAPEIWGNYALERLSPGGDYHVAQLNHEQLRGLKAAQYAATRANLGSCLEHNLGSLTLHWQGLSAPAARHARNLAFHAWNPIAQTNGFLLEEFDWGLELRPLRQDTANAVGEMLDALDETGIVVYLGDDQIDRNAFDALREQDLAVLVSSGQRDTPVDLWIRSSEELFSFFNSWLAACRQVQ